MDWHKRKYRFEENLACNIFLIKLKCHSLRTCIWYHYGNRMYVDIVDSKPSHSSVMMSNIILSNFCLKHFWKGKHVRRVWRKKYIIRFLSFCTVVYEYTSMWKHVNGKSFMKRKYQNYLLIYTFIYLFASVFNQCQITKSNIKTCKIHLYTFYRSVLVI